MTMTEEKTTEPEEITPTYLAVKWTTSRGRDTYGYNICTVTDQETGKRFRCMGGGYDMLGTSFGEWMQDTYQAHLIAIAERAYAHWTETTDGPWERAFDQGDLYGLSWNRHFDGSSRMVIDGGCGISSVEKIAKAIGLRLSRTWDRKGSTTGYVVSRAADASDEA